jgi:hypothetical protein
MASTFRGTLREEAGTFVEVPPDVLAALGPRKRPAVRKREELSGTFYPTQTFSQ